MLAFLPTLCRGFSRCLAAGRLANDETKETVLLKDPLPLPEDDLMAFDGTGFIKG